MKHLNPWTLVTACTLLVGGCFSPDMDVETATDGDASGDDTDPTAGDDATPDGGSQPVDTDGDDGDGDGDAPSTDDMQDDGATEPDPNDSTDGGMDDASTTGDTDEPTTTDDPTTDDGALDCDAGTTCVPAAPIGWSGPAAVFMGAGAAPACPAAFPTADFTGGFDVQASAAQCDCDCGEATGFDCSITVTEAGEQCGDLIFNPDSWTLDGGECQAVTTSANAFSTTSPVLDVSGASCAPTAGEVIAPPSWGSNVQACLAEGAAACDGGTCAGELEGGYDNLCIYSNGDVECPAGDFSVKQLVHASWNDTRDCSTCSCDDPEGTCGGEVSYQGGCTGPLFVYYGDNQPPGCDNATGQPSALRYAWEPDVSCAPSGGDAVGSVTPSGAVTMCCTQ